MSRNKADQSRLDDIHNIPCVCCSIMEVDQPWPTEAHHDVSGGYREHSGGDQASSAICSWHHRALCLDGWTSNQMLRKYGPSLKWQGKKGGFAERFGSGAKLIERTTDNIKTLA